MENKESDKELQDVIELFKKMSPTKKSYYYAKAVQSFTENLALNPHKSFPSMIIIIFFNVLK